MLDFITWLGHASFRIELSRIIYIDPWKIKDDDKADIILISHPHEDHYSPDDVLDLLKDDTIIITVEEIAEKLKSISKHVYVLKPGDRMKIGDIIIIGTRAYNTNKSYHPKEKKWLGFLIKDLNYTIYYAGDTDLIDEMEKLDNVDVALLPISGTYVMDPKEAAKAAALINPTYVLPYHYGDFIGGEEELEEFKTALFDEDPEINILE